MKKLTAIMAPLALGAAVCGLLRADESGGAPSVGGQELINYQAANTYLWYAENKAAIAKDPETMGVTAVMSAADLLSDKPPQVKIDFFNKALFDTKLRPVQREIRMQLFNLYKQQGQTDRAMDQLQQLMMDQ